jgi:glycosyltransferase involved in cell wall biosynthesis
MDTRKRIAIISEDMVEPWDEGIKKFAYSISRALQTRDDVLPLNIARSGKSAQFAQRIPGTRTFWNRDLRRKLRTFSPHCVLYIPSPSSTLASFFRARVLRSFAPRAAHCMVAMIPRRHGRRWRPFLSMTAPDVVFVPSYASLLHLHRLSIRGELLPIGVDVALFRKTDRADAAALRRRHGIGTDAFVLLHVGHLSRKRNLESLSVLKSRLNGAEVIVVSSTSTPEDRLLRREMEAAGIRIIREYVPVEEFYRLADCYVFPVVEHEGCIELPLSVLEALASGLPVLTTPFGGLRDFFPEGPDVIYWDRTDDLIEKAAALKAGTRPAVRDMAQFSWERIAEALLEKLDCRHDG